MPLLGPSSYPPTFQVFLKHWALVDAALGAGDELVLPDGLTRAGAEALNETLLTQVGAVRMAALELAIARAQSAIERARLRARLEQLTRLVRAYWARTPWVGLVPGLPPLDAAPDKFMKPCRDARRLWALLEAEAAPPGAAVPIFLDPGGVYGLADYEAQMAGLVAQFVAIEEALWARAVAVERRDALLGRVKEVLMALTRAVAGRLPPSHAMVVTMPALWPPPGHTPEPVVLSGAWDAVAGAARLTWEASADAMLSHYELYGCAGPEYDSEAAEKIARVEKDATREVLTQALLAAPGAQAVFRVYVVLETGNERASEVVGVGRL